MISEEEPDLEGLHFYIDAFEELSTCRQMGVGPVPIPFTAIQQYCTIYDIEDRDEFTYLIRAMDNALLKLQRSKEESSGPTKSN